MFTILLLSLCGLCAGYEAYHDTQSCGENRGKLMDDNTRYKILYYHEGTRNVLALGESPGYATGFLPPAKKFIQNSKFAVNLKQCFAQNSISMTVDVVNCRN
ncbi:hypothetical protein COOONC_25908 [Cooperia oncophora]